jgi:hypothetical protein
MDRAPTVLHLGTAGTTMTYHDRETTLQIAMGANPADRTSHPLSINALRFAHWPAATTLLSVDRERAGRGRRHPQVEYQTVEA